MLQNCGPSHVAAVLTIRKPKVTVRIRQGCGLGLDISVSTSHLGLISRKTVNVSVSGGRRLGLSLLRLVPKTNFQPNCAGHINKTYGTQCEHALDVVSLCCTYYCSSY